MNSENINQFWSTFNDSTAEIRKLYLQASTNESYEDVLTLKQKLNQLQDFTTISTALLPSFDIKRSLHEISVLQGQCRELELVLQPRQKFRFSDYTMKHFILKEMSIGSGEPVPSQYSDGGPESNIHDQNSSTLEIDGCYSITDKSDCVLEYNTSDLCREVSSLSSGDNIQLLISNCHNAYISLVGVLGSVRLENCTACYIFLGPCSTSCYIEGCVDSIICCASHQLRIHNTHECALYVRANSHPIFEDCSHIGFAEYELLDYIREDNGLHVTLSQDIDITGLSDAHCWKNVVDFKWHKDTVSPNYYIISATDLKHYPHVLRTRESAQPMSPENVLPNAQLFNTKPIATTTAAVYVSRQSVVLPGVWKLTIKDYLRGRTSASGAPMSAIAAARKNFQQATSRATAGTAPSSTVPTLTSAKETVAVENTEDGDDDEDEL